MKKIMTFIYVAVFSLVMNYSATAAESMLMRGGEVIKTFEYKKPINVVTEKGKKVSIQAESGKKFVVIVVELKKGYSIGKYDYVVSPVSDRLKTYPCIGVAPEGTRLNLAQWEHIVAKDGQRFNVFFEVPEKSHKMHMRFALDVVIKHKNRHVPNLNVNNFVKAGLKDNKLHLQ